MHCTNEPYRHQKKGKGSEAYDTTVQLLTFYDLVLGLGESLCCKNGVQQSFLSGEVLK